MRTFTRKTNRVNGVGGSKIRAADINELQEAIEDLQTGDLAIPVNPETSQLLEDAQTALASIEVIIESLPEDVSQVANMRVGIFNVLDYGAVGDGVTDDTEAIQDAIDAAIAAGGGVVDGGGQRYRLTLRSGFTLSSIKYALMVWGGGITLRNMALVMTEEHANSQSVVMVSGHAKAAASFATADMVLKDINFNPNSNFTIHDIDPAAYLDPSVTLSTAGDATNFAVGDVVYIRSGQTLAGPGEGQPDSEINIVTGIAGGVLSLAYPLTKPYVQEYFADADRDTVTTTSVTAHPAYLGVANVNAAIIRGFRCENVHFEISADTYFGWCVNTTQVLNPEFENCTATLKNTGFQAWGSHRFLSIRKCRVDIERTIGVDAWFSGDKGCTDISVTDSEFATYGTYGSNIHLNEGCANVALKNCTFQNANAFDLSAAIYAAAARGYRHTIQNCRFNGEDGGALISLAQIDGVFIDGCDLARADGGISLSIEQSSNIRLGQNDYGSGHPSLHPSETGGVSALPQTMATWCYYNSAGGEVVVGTLPKYSTILNIQIFVAVPFNAGSPTIQVGKAGAASWFMSAPSAVDANGYAAVAMEPTTLFLDSSAIELIAFVTPDGSSAGRAQVIVTYITGPVNA